MSIAERTAGGTAVRPVDIGHDLIGAVGADVAARLIAASTDLSLILDDAGFVRDVAVGSVDLSGEGLGDVKGHGSSPKPIVVAV